MVARIQQDATYDAISPVTASDAWTVTAEE